VPVNESDAAWAQYHTDRVRVGQVLAGKETAKALVRGLPGWDAPTLQNIQEGAYFLPMVARTLETFSGLVFLKSPTRTFPAGLEELSDDITQTGQEIDRFAEAALDGVLTTGAVGVLVDYPQTPEGVTRADAEANGYRPSLRLYDATTILAARVTKVGGALRLSHVRLLEGYEVAGADEFTVRTEPQIRVLDLGTDGSYRQRVFRKATANADWSVHETITPTMAGKAITEIPMFFSNTRDGEARCEKPPLTDLADINIAHLNNSAQAEWALAWLGAPMLFGSGIKLAEGETIMMGSSEAIVSPTVGAKLEVVQAGPEAVGALKQAMDDKRRDAAALGARMLLEGPKAAIAAETARIERAGETSVIGSIANAVSQCLTNALRFMAQWAGISGDVLYWLNTDLMPTRMTPQELQALLLAWQGGAISKRELFARFQEAEVVDPAKSFEDHEEEIAEEGPPLGELADDADGQGAPAEAA
jgi:hypothetical protein